MDTQPNTKKLYRSRTNRVIAGVCGGLGEYFGVDPIIFRVLFVILLFPGGVGFWIYIVMMIVVPYAPLSGQEEQSANRAKDFAQDVRQGANNLAQEIRNTVHTNDWRHNGRNVLGIIIVAIGAILLLGQFVPGFWFPWHLLWPVLVILIGVRIITRRR